MEMQLIFLYGSLTSQSNYGTPPSIYVVSLYVITVSMDEETIKPVLWRTYNFGKGGCSRAS